MGPKRGGGERGNPREDNKAEEKKDEEKQIDKNDDRETKKEATTTSASASASTSSSRLPAPLNRAQRDPINPPTPTTSNTPTPIGPSSRIPRPLSIGTTNLGSGTSRTVPSPTTSSPAGPPGSSSRLPIASKKPDSKPSTPTTLGLTGVPSFMRSTAASQGREGRPPTPPTTTTGPRAAPGSRLRRSEETETKKEDSLPQTPTPQEQAQATASKISQLAGGVWRATKSRVGKALKEFSSGSEASETEQDETESSTREPPSRNISPAPSDPLPVPPDLPRTPSARRPSLTPPPQPQSSPQLDPVPTPPKIKRTPTPLDLGSSTPGAPQVTIEPATPSKIQDDKQGTRETKNYDPNRLAPTGSPKQLPDFQDIPITPLKLTPKTEKSGPGKLSPVDIAKATEFLRNADLQVRTARVEEEGMNNPVEEGEEEEEIPIPRPRTPPYFEPLTAMPARITDPGAGVWDPDYDLPPQPSEIKTPVEDTLDVEKIPLPDSPDKTDEPPSEERRTDDPNRFTEEEMKAPTSVEGEGTTPIDEILNDESNLGKESKQESEPNSDQERKSERGDSKREDSDEDSSKESEREDSREKEEESEKEGSEEKEDIEDKESKQEPEPSPRFSPTISPQPYTPTHPPRRRLFDPIYRAPNPYPTTGLAPTMDPPDAPGPMSLMQQWLADSARQSSAQRDQARRKEEKEAKDQAQRKDEAEAEAAKLKWKKVVQQGMPQEFRDFEDLLGQNPNESWAQQASQALNSVRDMITELANRSGTNSLTLVDGANTHNGLQDQLKDCEKLKEQHLKAQETIKKFQEVVQSYIDKDEYRAQTIDDLETELDDKAKEHEKLMKEEKAKCEASRRADKIAIKALQDLTKATTLDPRFPDNEVARLRKQLSDLQAEHTAATAQLQNELQTARQAGAGDQGASEALEKAKKDLKDLKAEYAEELQKLQERLKSSNGDVQKARNINREYKDEINQLTADNREMRDKEARKTGEENSQLREKGVITLDEHIRILEEQKGILETRLATQVYDLSTCNTELDTAKEKLSEMKKQLDETKRQLAQTKRPPGSKAPEGMITEEECTKRNREEIDKLEKDIRRLTKNGPNFRHLIDQDLTGVDPIPSLEWAADDSALIRSLSQTVKYYTRLIGYQAERLNGHGVDTIQPDVRALFNESEADREQVRTLQVERGELQKRLDRAAEDLKERADSLRDARKALNDCNENGEKRKADMEKLQKTLNRVKEHVRELQHRLGDNAPPEPAPEDEDQDQNQPTAMGINFALARAGNALRIMRRERAELGAIIGEDTANAVEAVEEALRIAANLDPEMDGLEIARAHFEAGIVHYYTGNTNEANGHFTDAQTLRENLPPEEAELVDRWTTWLAAENTVETRREGYMRNRGESSTKSTSEKEKKKPRKDTSSTPKPKKSAPKEEKSSKKKEDNLRKTKEDKSSKEDDGESSKKKTGKSTPKPSPADKAKKQSKKEDKKEEGPKPGKETEGLKKEEETEEERPKEEERTKEEESSERQTEEVEVFGK